MAMVILCVVLALVLGANIAAQAKNVAMGIIILLLAIIILFVLRRIPRDPHGLVASEDYYALDRHLDFLASYGTNYRRRTRKEVTDTLEKTTRDERLLPPPQQPQLPKGKGE